MKRFQFTTFKGSAKPLGHRVANAPDFFPPGRDGRSNGAIYDEYRKTADHTRFAHVITETFPDAINILLAGCGFGFTLDELYLINPALNAWGMDASAWAVSEGRLRIAHGGKIIAGDVTSVEDLDLVTALANISTWDLIVTEDLLNSLGTDETAGTALETLRARSLNLFHLIVPTQAYDPLTDSGNVSPLLWKSITEWKQVVGLDPVYDIVRGVIF